MIEIRNETEQDAVETNGGKLSEKAYGVQPYLRIMGDMDTQSTMHTPSEAETYAQANTKHRPSLSQSILKHRFVSDSSFCYLKQGVQGPFQQSKAHLPYPHGSAETHDLLVSGTCVLA